MPPEVLEWDVTGDTGGEEPRRLLNMLPFLPVEDVEVRGVGSGSLSLEKRGMVVDFGSG